jgi:hypothetical protein
MRSLKGVRSAPEGRGREGGDVEEEVKEGEEEVEEDEGERGADNGEEKYAVRRSLMKSLIAASSLYRPALP